MAAIKKEVDWLGVEADYRAGELTLRDIGEKYGCTEGGVRHKAKQAGWMRNPSGLKQERFKAAISGVTTQNTSQTSQDGSITTQAAADIIDAEGQRDVVFTHKAVEFFESVLDTVAASLPGQDSPKAVKTLTETAVLAVNSYRRLRGLEDSAANKGGLEDWLETVGGK